MYVFAIVNIMEINKIISFTKFFLLLRWLKENVIAFLKELMNKIG